MSGYYSTAEKRRIEGGSGAITAYEPIHKRARGPNAELALGGGSYNRALQISKGSRSSSLLAPIMLLTGHQKELFSGRFHPDGSFLASSGFDRQIFFWNTFGECENFHVMAGHTGAILDMHFSTGGDFLYTCSTDKTLSIWDTQVGVRVRKLRGHTSYVNALHPARRGPQLVVSASDDSTVRLWDARRKTPVKTLQDQYQLTAITFNDTADQVITGGIDNVLKLWDLRKDEVAFLMQGHQDTVTGLTLSHHGGLVLSNSMDGTLRVWDVRPFAPPERCVSLYQGHQHNFEKNLLRCSWSPDDARITCGSADKCVYVWDFHSRRILYKLPGHLGSVNDVRFHPKEPILMSVGSDKQIFLGEIEP
ncbi:U5 small nuclear ribonucleoprotein 40 kDa protein-like [Tropilaelaps mercedesae]|uniref:U5 small nuclear ribonucleoprotein 40 kDa protein n=1 Tax=Tropilaelaps mercedesae TaxID=418985 RepID=A0A1V9XYG4_9ACAR|nr:U5 small nuclear ribonucleoprotein 40 kDa protein-like [Tropilaelaps mercedesae]